MPSNITSPATLTYSGGTFRDTRVEPARFRYSGSLTLTVTRDTSVSAAVTVPTLDRLTEYDRPQGFNQREWSRQVQIWQKTMEAIESALEAVNAKVDDNSAILARLLAAEELAQAANDNAVRAQETAETVQAATSETLAVIDPVYQTEFDTRVTR